MAQLVENLRSKLAMLNQRIAEQKIKQKKSIEMVVVEAEDTIKTLNQKSLVLTKSKQTHLQELDRVVSISLERYSFYLIFYLFI